MTRHASSKPGIRLAGIDDLASVVGLHRQCRAQAGRTGSGVPFLFQGDTRRNQSILRERILDRCLLVMEKQGRAIAAAGVDLDHCSLSELLVARPAQGERTFESLVAAAERLAVKFGLEDLDIRLPLADASRFHALGYREFDPGALAQASAGAAPALSMQRSLRRRQTAYGRKVRAIAKALGIPPAYGRVHRLALQPEAKRLCPIGVDVFGRKQQLAPRAAAAWRRMRQTAMVNGVELQPVSAWRSVAYQSGLLQRKLEKGMSMVQILRTSAAPGYSEHHTGRAIDITTPGCAALEEEFEHGSAFHWLQRHARDFGFRLSFPRNNRHSLAYEPWHWCFEGYF